MTRVTWGLMDSSDIEQGVDRGILYNSYGSYAWTGLTEVSESFSNSSDDGYYLDGLKQANGLLNDDVGIKLTAFTYPNVLANESTFSGFSWRTKISDDAYRIHILYNVFFETQDKTYTTLSGDTDVVEFEWEASSRPIPLPDFAPTSYLIIEMFSSTAQYFKDTIEDLIYGNDEHDPVLLTPSDFIDIFREARNYTALLIIDHGDGRWTAIGSDDIVSYSDATTFQIESPTVTYLDSKTYTVYSM